MASSRFFPYVLGLALFLAAPFAVVAAESTAVAAPVTKAQAIKASDAANEKTSPSKEAPGAKRDETHTQKDPTMTNGPAANGADAKAKPPTDAEKAAAIAAADAITTYDESKVVGHAKPWEMYYQPAESPVMHKMEQLHDFIFAIICVIVIFVMGLLGYVCLRFNSKAHPHPKRFSHNTTVEIVWTVIPILILVAIGIPSLRVHFDYIHNEDIINSPDLTLKVVGHQWYWSYEYPEQGIAYDSNVTKDADLKGGQPRLLTVDNPVVVPVNKVVRVQMTGADVIHAWAVPAFGVKQDVVPGRLNETWFKAEKEGIYYGQCSELCGKFHGFMPIEIHVVSQDDFNRWVAGAKLKFANDDTQQFAALTH